MLTRLARAFPRFFASALIVFLFAQPFTALAFDDCSNSMSNMPCCKDKCCCRRMHHASTGPGFTSQDCCGRCHVSVRNTQPVAARIDSALASAELVRSRADVVFRSAWLALAQPNPVLFERPPPSVT